MNVEQFHHALVGVAGDAAVRFQLPSGELLPDHFHVTEVGRVDKNFIDCGGTRRQSASCLLQTWVADDLDHRLAAEKLAKIIRMAGPLLGSFDLPVEIEYGAEVAAQYTVSTAHEAPNGVTFLLSGKQTDCLARDKCGVEGTSNGGCC